MARGPRRLDPELQHQRDMLELAGYPAFWRFLFTVAERAGICATAYGTEVDTFAMDGRRSLGIDILRMADEALPVRIEARSPFNALGRAIAEASRLQPQENLPDENLDDDDVDDERS